MNKLLNKLEYKFGKICIPNLMLYIIIAIGAAFIVDLFVPDVSLYFYMVFSRELIMAGEWWRLISWIFLYGTDNILFLVISLYFSYFIGSGLEYRWGSFKFNVYYLCGILFTIAGGFISGFTTNMWLNYSLFFAFATLYPDMEVRLFFFIPVKMKWLALLDLVYFAVYLVIGTMNDRIAILVSMLNFFLFFYEDFGKMIKRQINYFKHKQKYKNNRY